MILGIVRQKKALIVDDDTSILNNFRRLLEEDGFAVDTASTGKEAIKKLKKNDFDVCLVDFRLPDIVGTEIIKQITNPKTVKLLVTGYSSEKTGINAADSGADDYLAKPVKAEDLTAIVKERLRIKELSE